MFIHTDSAQILAHMLGSGDKVLVTHGGWVGSGELWLPVAERLRQGWRTLIFDHRGSGATLSSAPRITFDLLLDDLVRVLDAYKVENCVLAGESMGAMVVLEAALRWPDRFRGIVLVGARIDGSRTPGRDRLIAGCAADFPATMSAFVDACTPEPDCAAERAWGKKIVMRSNAKEAIELMECMEWLDFADRVADIAVPALVLHGARDVIAPVETAQLLAKRIPRASLAIAEEGGHVPTVTRPDWVAAQIEARFG